jgi:hypothetical protein
MRNWKVCLHEYLNQYFTKWKQKYMHNSYK